MEEIKAIIITSLRPLGLWGENPENSWMVLEVEALGAVMVLHQWRVAGHQ